MKIFILAQGKQARLQYLGHPKQLLSISGRETIIGRTVRLLGDEWFTPIVVVPWSGVNWRAELPTTALYSLADPGACIVAGLSQVVAEFWAPRALFLLGDVVYSREALAHIVETAWDNKGIYFAGTAQLTASEGELFACSYDDVKQFVACIQAAKCMHMKGDTCQPGHLRNLWWTVQDRQKGDFGSYRYDAIDDWTHDIDTPGDVMDLLPKLCEKVAEEG